MIKKGAKRVVDDLDRLRELAANAVAGAAAIQRLQAEYDVVAWQIQAPGWAKARHLLYHLLAVTSELARIVERLEHAQHGGEAVTEDEFTTALAARADLAAKLAFHAAQVANLAGTDLGTALLRLQIGGAQRLAPSSVFALLGELDPPVTTQARPRAEPQGS